MTISPWRGIIYSSTHLLPYVLQVHARSVCPYGNRAIGVTKQVCLLRKERVKERAKERGLTLHIRKKGKEPFVIMWRTCLPSSLLYVCLATLHCLISLHSVCACASSKKPFFILLLPHPSHFCFTLSLLSTSTPRIHPRTHPHTTPPPPLHTACPAKGAVLEQSDRS